MVRIAALFTVASAMEWNDYKQQFGKVYNGAEDDRRQAVFEENKKVWGEKDGVVMGATQFSDWTLEEFQAAPIRGLDLGLKSNLPYLGEHVVDPSVKVGAIDWTTKGAVTPVKDQGQCGSCWAFSTTGGLEGSWEINTGSLVSMSEQQFVDCSKQNSGCNGGLMNTAFQWAESQNIATESSYPYTARDGSCKSSFTTAIPSGGVTGYKNAAGSSALQSALNTVGPVSVAIEADQSVFQQYTGGVISSGCGTNLDHGVLAVGINSDGSIKVKNSWGSSWGVNGYVNIDLSQCGITNEPSYPTVSGAPAPPPAPTPPTPPAPTPAPTPAGTTHYGAPPCMDDEMAGDFEGGGKICSAPCSTDSDCPTDVPEGALSPEVSCALQDQDTGASYCGMMCGLFGGDCATGQTCSDSIQGVCVWPGQTSGKGFTIIPSKKQSVAV